ncbi:ADP-ribosylglycohydrolase family protein, partial [bacterium]|nr:ADP-ribosylglycohydrolase family protein [bacterium]
MNKNYNMLLKIQGSLIGLAIADTMGAILEFKEKKFVKNKVVNMPEIVSSDSIIGKWTDDTSMALCLAQSLIDSKGFNLKDQCDKYINWLNNGYMSSMKNPYGVGQTILKALFMYIETKNPITKLHNNFSAGNGSIMRLAPIPLFFSNDIEKAIKYSIEQSKATHIDKVCLDACGYMGGIVFGALQGETKEKILSSLYSPLNNFFDKYNIGEKVFNIAKGSFKEKNENTIKNSGYVIDTLEAALWAFYTTDNFEDGCIKAINLCGDADTIGAVYGQIAGAYYGINNIKKEWFDKVYK